jgi:hypothetical protein
MAIEQPRYTILESFDGAELREYGPQLVAEVDVDGTLESAGSAGFRVLAGYIFGKNRGRRTIAMTAPVTQSAGQRLAMTAPVTQTGAEGRWVLRFVMPAGQTPETLPEPLDSRVRLGVLPARRVAALRYSGTWSGRRYREHLARLRAAMAARGLRPVGEPEWARYDAPMVPWFLRRNEILVEVASG